LPAPCSTATLKPSASSCSTVFGVAATRASLGYRSLVIPISIVFPFIRGKTIFFLRRPVCCAPPVLLQTPYKLLKIAFSRQLSAGRFTFLYLKSPAQAAKTRFYTLISLCPAYNLLRTKRKTEKPARQKALFNS